jgi:protein-S-isoprenylcysteine O-methyltransferase Ste14
MIKKLRIRLTLIFIVLLLTFITISESAWEDKCPLLTAIFFIIGMLFVAIASLGRLWCSLYVAGRKTNFLIIEGPYSISRNPLYFFSLIGAIGVGLASETILIPTIVAAAFAAYYPFVIRNEENKLQAKHGKRFEEYVTAVPRFFPRMSKFTEPQEYIVKPIIFRKHIFSALWFIWLIGILELVEELHEIGIIPVMFKIY